MKEIQLEAYALEVLEIAGIKTGHIVLDFGCGSGTYAIPAAKMVGNQGKVYALDKDRKNLDKLMHRAESANLGNIERIDTSVRSEIKLATESIDMVILFDVFHSYHFPGPDERRKLLDEVHRILKPGGFLTVYPKHLESEAKGEIEQASFYLVSESSATLIHDSKDLEKGQVLSFKKHSF